MTLGNALKAFLLFVSGLILEPLITSIVIGPTLPFSKIAITVGAAAIISAPVYIPMFRASMSEAVIVQLNAISLNPWVWAALLAVFWLYIAAWPISNYYVDRRDQKVKDLTSQLHDSTKVLEDFHKRVNATIDSMERDGYPDHLPRSITILQATDAEAEAKYKKSGAKFNPPLAQRSDLKHAIAEARDRLEALRSGP